MRAGSYRKQWEISEESVEKKNKKKVQTKMRAPILVLYFSYSFEGVSITLSLVAVHDVIGSCAHEGGCKV